MASDTCPVWAVALSSNCLRHNHYLDKVHYQHLPILYHFSTQSDGSLRSAVLYGMSITTRNRVMEMSPPLSVMAVLLDYLMLPKYGRYYPAILGYLLLLALRSHCSIHCAAPFLLSNPSDPSSSAATIPKWHRQRWRKRGFTSTSLRMLAQDHI
jgi:hypothetical protein